MCSTAADRSVLIGGEAMPKFERSIQGCSCFRQSIITVCLNMRNETLPGFNISARTDALTEDELTLLCVAKDKG